MKKKIIFLLMAIAGMSAKAQDYDFIYSRPDSSWFQCIITSDSTVSVNGGGMDTLHNLIFPETVTHNGNSYTVTAIADHAFTTLLDCKSLYFSNTITTIGDYSFNGFDIRDSIYFGTGLTSIGNDCFCHTTVYRVIFNAKNCLSLGRDFYSGKGGSSDLTKLIFGDSVQVIPNIGFVPCYADVTVGISVTNIDDSAAYIFRTHHVYMRGLPPTLSVDALAAASETDAIYVPCEYWQLYLSAPGWSQLQNLHPRVPVLKLQATNGSAEILTPATCDNHQMTIRARANDGWRFTEWSDGNTDTLRILTVDSDMTLRARFEKIIDTSNFYIYYDFENEDDDTAWTRSVMTPAASWWIGSARSITGNRSLYVGGVRRDNGIAIISIGGSGGGYIGGAGSSGNLFAYTRIYVPAGMYMSYYDYAGPSPQLCPLTLALVPDSIELPEPTTFYSSEAELPDESIILNGVSWYESGWTGLDLFDKTVNVPDSGYYNLVAKWSWGVLELEEGDTIGAVVDNILLEKKDSVVLFNSTGNACGWTEGGGTFAYGDTATLTVHPYKGFRFVRWFNGDTNTVMKYVARKNMIIDAVFVPDTFSIIVDTLASHASVVSFCGSHWAYELDCSDFGDNSYRAPMDSYVTVEIVPDSGYVFLAWQDGKTENPRELRINGDNIVIKPITIAIQDDDSVPATLYIDFEDSIDNSQWVFQNGDNENRWVIDTAAHSEGSRGLYVSNDNGATNHYYNDRFAEASVYRTMYLEQGLYKCSYDWRCNGEPNYDYMSVGITKNDGTVIYNGINLAGQSEWQRGDAIFTVSQAGDYRLTFYWKNDWNTGDNPAAAVDSIVIKKVGEIEWVLIESSYFYHVHGSLSGTGYYHVGDTAVLVATPNEYFHFRQWENGDTNRTRRFVVTAESGTHTHTPQFAPDTFMVSVVPTDTLYTVLGTGVHTTDVVFGTLPTATLTVIPAWGYAFQQWTDGNTDNPRHFVIDRDTLLQPIVVSIDSLFVRQRILGNGFEKSEDDSLWTFANGDQPNVWVIDTATQSEGQRGLYISNDGGITNNYNGNISSDVYAYRTLHLAAGTYLYSYDWRCNAEPRWDYMRAVLYDSSNTLTAGSGLPDGGMPLDGGSQLVGSSEWQTLSGTFTVAQECDYLLTFYWRNDNSVCHNPAAAVDNITLQRLVPIAECDYVPPAVTVYDTVCNGESLSFHGTEYANEGSYSFHSAYHTYDDTVYTLHLAVRMPVHMTATETVCDSYTWHDTPYTVSGKYTYTHADVNGCTQVDTLHLTVNNSSIVTLSATACDNYTWNGTTYTASGTPTYQTSNVAGCDSTVTLNLTINYSNTATETATACDNYTWNGTTYTTSGTPTYQTTNAAGCDSTVTLHLTVNYSNTGDTSATACDSFTWWNTDYTNSTDTPTHVYSNAAGCDSTVTLNLTINYSNTATETVTACDNYTWNGTTYTTSGTPTYQTTNAAGCDSTVTLHLTVNYSNTGDTSATACDSFTWWNTDYTNSTDTPTHVYSNAAGCDSTVTLHLTVNYSNTGDTTATACDSFTWWNTDYTNSTDSATHAFVNVAGCDSVVTLHLTVNHSTTVYDTVIIGGNLLPFDYNGVSIESAGEYTITLVTSEGCDSIVMLHVETTTGIEVVDNNEVLVYPNPTNGTLSIVADRVLRVEVIDMMGRCVASFDNSRTIDISNLPQGDYMLRVKTPQGVAVKKVAKK